MRKIKSSLSHVAKLVKNNCQDMEGENSSWLPDLFVSSDGESFAERIISLYDFASHFVFSSVYSNDRLCDSVLGLFGDSYIDKLEAQGYSKEQAHNIASPCRKQVELMLSAGGRGAFDSRWVPLFVSMMVIAISAGQVVVDLPRDAAEGHPKSGLSWVRFYKGG